MKSCWYTIFSMRPVLMLFQVFTVLPLVHALWALLQFQVVAKILILDGSCALLFFILYHLSSRVVPPGSPPLVREVFQKAEGGRAWALPVRRIERDLMALKIRSILAERPYRGGSPQAIWDAELSELSEHIWDRVEALGSTPPSLGEIRRALEQGDAQAASQQDYEKKMSVLCASIVEKYLTSR
jgi:hypothetical protein